MTADKSWDFQPHLTVRHASCGNALLTSVMLHPVHLLPPLMRLCSINYPRKSHGIMFLRPLFFLANSTLLLLLSALPPSTRVMDKINIFLTLSSWCPSNSCPVLSGAMMMSYRFHNCNRIELLGFLQSIQSSFLDMVDCPTNCIISWLSLVQQLLPTPEVNLLPTSAKCPCSSVLSILRTTSPFSCPQFSDAQSTCTAKAASALGTGSTFSNSTQT